MLDHDDAEAVGLGPHPLDLAADRPLVARADGGEERRDLGVTGERDEEADVVRARRADRDGHAGRCPSSQAVAERAGAERDSGEDQRQAAERGSRHLLVEEQRAVGERETGHQVGDEAEPPRPVEPDDPEEEDLRERGAEERQGE